MAEFSDINDLVNFVREAGYGRVGIDGTNGAGKTTVAKELSSRLGYRLLSLDGFLEKNQGGFIEHLKYSELSAEINSLKAFVIEGVCLLEVLSRLETEVEVLVYIKRQQHGLWADERECEIEGDVEEFIGTERELIKRLSRLEGSGEETETLGLGEEIIRYHSSHRPQHKANAIFWRNDC